MPEFVIFDGVPVKEDEVFTLETLEELSNGKGEDEDE